MALARTYAKALAGACVLAQPTTATGRLTHHGLTQESPALAPKQVTGNERSIFVATAGWHKDREAAAL
jgi:hypothetical protein